MISINNIRIYFLGFIFLTVSLGTGCSYVSDMVEGAITKRSGFSINAEYNAAAKTVTVTWDELDTNADFTGYEIYITHEKDDEYVGYDLVASRYYPVVSNLNLNMTNSYVHNVANIYNGIDLDGPGRYFYRVGIIHWDDKASKRTAANGYDVDPSTGLWLDNEVNYNGKTNINKISGFKPVDIK